MAVIRFPRRHIEGGVINRIAFFRDRNPLWMGYLPGVSLLDNDFLAVFLVRSRVVVGAET